ncbi:flagellar filament capping protein FliD [Pantoea agglomerans]|uniref:Flagellar filament capping protein FliD n=1 Tax=Enterobacter agglomerans TaxID=549 RepID=A0ACC5RIZ7_ENTAG|nr:flagellar filament capping protein FliD [Pantoea agglomerans]MBK4724681.1 flagellar filament capping protein FliD [Pantoea agglomerans]
MSWLDSFDPQTVSQQLAMASISAQQSQLKNQQNRVSAEQKALTTLKTALTDFQSALKGFSVSGSSGGMVKNSATASQEGYVTLNASSSAKKGLYNINVQQTASADQKAFESLSDADIANASGNLKISIGDKDVDIDMSTISSLSELRDKINAESGNSGATASLVKQNGQNILMISSDKTGADNAVTLSADDAALHNQLTTKATQISTAKDAVITMGEGAMSFTSSTNDFKGIIPGVDLTVIRTTTEGEPLIINIDNDTTGTREQADKFVDAWNSLRTKLNELTKSGNSDGSITRGALAGDSGISALETKLNELLRSEFNGAKLSEFGITSDKNGQLKLDGKLFEETMKEKPGAFNALFDGSSGLLKRVEKEALDTLLSGSKGTLKQRQEGLDRKSEQLTRKESQIQTRYETAFNRYVKEFTNMKTIIAQMNQTMGQFF